MITVYRTFSHEFNNSLKFVKQEDLKYVEELEVKLFESFIKKTLITKDRETRFGVEGYPAPAYFCESMDTTLYEYAYWILKTPKILKKGIKITTIKCKLVHDENAIFIDIENLSNDLKNKIMSLADTGYIGANSWLKSLENIPDLIKYNSIRSPHAGGKNFATFTGTISDISFSKYDNVVNDGLNPDSVYLIAEKRSIIPIK